jgi:hypothetical protein
MGKIGTSGGGTVHTRKNGTKEARLLVPQEYRAAVGRTYLYGKTEKEAKRKRSKALADLIKNGPRAFDTRRITFGGWLERWTLALRILCIVPLPFLPHGVASFHLSTLEHDAIRALPVRTSQTSVKAKFRERHTSRTFGE